MFTQMRRESEGNPYVRLPQQESPSWFQKWRASKGFEILDNISSKVGNDSGLPHGYVDPNEDFNNQSMREELCTLGTTNINRIGPGLFRNHGTVYTIDDFRNRIIAISSLISKYGCYLCQLHPLDLVKMMPRDDINALEDFRAYANLLVRENPDFKREEVYKNLESKFVLLHRFVNDLCYIISSVVMGRIDEGNRESQLSRVSDAFRRMRAMVFLMNGEGIKFDKGLTKEEEEEYLKTLRLRHLEKDMDIEERLTSARRLVSVKESLKSVTDKYGRVVNEENYGRLRYLVSLYIDYSVENTSESKLLYIELLDGISKLCKDLIYKHPENDNMFAYMVMRILSREFKQYGIDTHLRESTETSEEEFRKQANNEIAGAVWATDYQSLSNFYQEPNYNILTERYPVFCNERYRGEERVYESEPVSEEPTITVHVNHLNDLASFKTGHAFFELRYNCWNETEEKFSRRQLNLGLIGNGGCCARLFGISGAIIVNQVRSTSDVSLSKKVKHENIARAISSVTSFLERFPILCSFTTNCVNFVRTVSEDALGSSNAFSSILDTWLPCRVAENIISSTLNNISSLKDIEAGVGSLDKVSIRKREPMFAVDNEGCFMFDRQGHYKLGWTTEDFEKELREKAKYKREKSRGVNDPINNRLYAVSFKIQRLGNMVSKISPRDIDNSKFSVAAYVKEVMKAIKEALVLCKEDRELSVFLLEVNTRFRRYLKWILSF